MIQKKYFKTDWVHLPSCPTVTAVTGIVLWWMLGDIQKIPCNNHLLKGWWECLLWCRLYPYSVFRWKTVTKCNIITLNYTPIFALSVISTLGLMVFYMTAGFIISPKEKLVQLETCSFFYILGEEKGRLRLWKAYTIYCIEKLKIEKQRVNKNQCWLFLFV